MHQQLAAPGELERLNHEDGYTSHLVDLPSGAASNVMSLM